MNKLKEKKKIKFDAFVIIFLVIVFCYFLTLIIPSGEFTREEINGVVSVIPDSFHSTPKVYLKPQAIFQAIPEGLTASASMMFVVMMVAGCIEIYKRSDAINKLVSALLSKADKFGSEKILSLIMIMFGCLGGFLGWNMISFSVSPSSVYTVGISHEVAQLPMLSGFAFRLTLLIIFNIIMQFYVLRYAKKVKKDKSYSIMQGIDDSQFRIDFSETLSEKMNGRQKLSLLVFLATFVAAIVGVSSKGWTMNDLGAAFFFAGVMGGIINGMNINEVIDGFISGAKDGLGPALVIGLARGIQWVLTTGAVIDPIINAVSKPLRALGTISTPIAVTFVIALFNGLITSGSAKATALMPILIPLADLVGMTRQTMILAFQIGDGLTNSLWFTSGTLLMFLTIAKIPLNRWYKFIWKLMLILFVVSFIALIVAVKIKYGPF